MPKPTIPAVITARVLEVMAEHVGPSRRWRYKRDFAKAMSIHFQEIYKWENGKGKVQYEDLVQLHRLLKVNMNYLILGQGEKYLTGESKSLQERLEVIEKKLKI